MALGLSGLSGSCLCAGSAETAAPTRANARLARCGPAGLAPAAVFKGAARTGLLAWAAARRESAFHTLLGTKPVSSPKPAAPLQMPHAQALTASGQAWICGFFFRVCEAGSGHESSSSGRLPAYGRRLERLHCASRGFSNKAWVGSRARASHGVLSGKAGVFKKRKGSGLSQTPVRCGGAWEKALKAL